MIVGGAAGTGMANVSLGADDLAGFAFALQLPLRRGQTYLRLGEDGLGLDLRQFANGAGAGLAGREEEEHGHGHADQLSSHQISPVTVQSNWLSLSVVSRLVMRTPAAGSPWKVRSAGSLGLGR
ncbi:hypothetical protein [Pseudomonas aeruginosa]|uniref:hypothetical protein n=1 Tax=Pseudomonas aeruginosa TaxID=287 RepID=UPI0037A992F3